LWYTDCRPQSKANDGDNLFFKIYNPEQNLSVSSKALPGSCTSPIRRLLLRQVHLPCLNPHRPLQHQLLVQLEAKGSLSNVPAAVNASQHSHPVAERAATSSLSSETVAVEPHFDSEEESTHL